MNSSRQQLLAIIGYGYTIYIHRYLTQLKNVTLELLKIQFTCFKITYFWMTWLFENYQTDKQNNYFLKNLVSLYDILVSYNDKIINILHR